MKLKDIGEFGFIDRISKGCLIRSDGVVQAIGDDAAAFEIAKGQLTLVTTDLLVERVHFLRDATTGFDLGYKALAVNLSDIAAMGGIAREAFISIAMPTDCDLGFLEDLYRGMQYLAGQHAVNLLGGDTTSSKADLVINVCVVGHVSRRHLLTRSAAYPGDHIFTTGFLGDSRAGLYLILNAMAPSTEDHKELYEAHVRPYPYLAEGAFLAAQPGVNAAIDLSDGLSSDLGHILSASGVGARLYREKIPISPHLQSFCARFGFEAPDYALTGGEDYTLVVTVAADQADTVKQLYEKRFGRQLFELGEITNSGKLEHVDAAGRITIVPASGWNHFTEEKSDAH
jgi:thiamine-monophosphate kinase